MFAAWAGGVVHAVHESSLRHLYNETMRIVPVDVYAFGNRAGPRQPRIEGFNAAQGQQADLAIGADGMLATSNESQGMSTFADPDQAHLTGHYYKLPSGTQLPQGLGINADGIDVEGGTFPPTHHTIYPTEAMPPGQFIRLLQDLPWEYGGKK